MGPEEAFWRRVKILLKEKKITQTEAARVCGMSLNTLRGWMSKGTNPLLLEALKLARLLNVSLEYLITGSAKDETGKINQEVLLLLEKASRKLNRTL